MSKRIIHDPLRVNSHVGSQHKHPVLRKLDKLRGFVRVFMDGKLECESDNLVVYTGREFVLPRLFFLDSTVGAVNDTYRNAIVSHFAIGNEGSVLSGGMPSVIAPQSTDTIAQITSGRAYSFNASDMNPKYVTVNGVTAAGKWIPYVRATDSVDMSKFNIVVNTTTGQLTELVLNCVVEENEPYTTDSFVKIDEAWLIIGSWSGNAYHNTSATFSPIELFAHVTFPPTWKDVTMSHTTIEWHILA